MKCGNLKLCKPRWKCSLCKDVVTRMGNKPVSVFTRVKRGKGGNPFQKNILENLSFHVNNNPFIRKNEVNVSVFKNRNDDKEAAIATFILHPVSVGNVPLPVQTSRKEIKIEAGAETCPSKISGLHSFEKLIVGSSPLPKMVIRSQSSNPLSLAENKLFFQSPELEGMRSNRTRKLSSLEHTPKVCTSTPLTGTSKKRRLSLPSSSSSAKVEHQQGTPPGQTSLLNFYSYTLKSKDNNPRNASHRNSSQIEEIERSSSIKEEQYSCSLCPNSKFKAKKSWKAHIVNIHKDLNVQILDTRQASKLGLNDSLLQCGKCEQVFKSEILVKAHLEIDHTEHPVQTGLEGNTEMKTPEAFAKNKDYKCDSCEKVCSNTGNLVNHFISQHSKKPTSNQTLHLECYICKEPVIFGDDYECHLNVAHNITEDEASLNYDDRSQDTFEEKESEVITLEDSLFALESEDEITCDICADPVMMGDDYRCHLRFSHDIPEEEIENLILKSGYTI